MDRKIYTRALGLLLVLAISLGCNLASSGGTTAVDTPGEPVLDDPTGSGDTQGQDNPAGTGSEPTNYTSITFEAGLTTVEALYPEEAAQCNPFPPGATGCSETYFPCGDSGGGGGGGGGGDVACLAMPDYCYSCFPDYGFTEIYLFVDPSYNPISPSTTRFQMEIAPDRTVVSFDWGTSYVGENPTLVELTSEPGSFYTRWDIYPPNNPDHTPGYIIVEGSGISFAVEDPVGEGNLTHYNVTGLEGSGTWEIGHPLTGTLGRGTWEFDSPYYSFVINP